MAKILIVGVGDVGSRVAAACLAVGHEVWAVRRHPERSHLPSSPRLHWLAQDACELSTEQLPSDLSAAVIALAPSGHSADDYERTYAGAARHLAGVLAPLGLAWAVWTSSTSVYGQAGGEWVDELSATEPSQPKAQILLAAERAIAGAAEHTTVLRLSGIYGPGRLRLLRWVQEARPVVRANPQWSNRIHVEDIVGAIMHLLATRLLGERLRDCYVLTDNTPTPQHEVLDWIAQRLALPPVPDAPAQPTSGKRLRSAFWAETGYQLRYPSYQQGYAAVLDRM